MPVAALITSLAAASKLDNRQISDCCGEENLFVGVVTQRSLQQPEVSLS